MRRQKLANERPRRRAKLELPFAGALARPEKSAPIAQPSRRAGVDVEPRGIALLEERRSRAGHGIDRQKPSDLLQAVKDVEEGRASLGPRDLGGVREALAIPLDPAREPSRRRDEAESHRGIGVSGARIGDALGRSLGVQGIWNRKHFHARRIGFLVKETRPVGRPPKAARSVQLLRRDKLGESVRELRPTAMRDSTLLAGRERHRVEVPISYVGDTPAIGREMRVGDAVVLRSARRHGVERLRLAARAVDDERDTREQDEHFRTVAGYLER